MAAAHLNSAALKRHPQTIVEKLGSGIAGRVREAMEQPVLGIQV